MNILPPLVGRIIWGITLTATGLFFIAFGYATASQGFGVGLMLVGVMPLILAPIYVWRGGRLGAEIQGDRLIVHHYFRDRTVLLERPWRVYRSIDATVVQTLHEQFVLDDCYFSDLAARDALLKELTDRAEGQYHTLPSDEQ